MQDCTKEHNSEWRFYLPYSLQTAGLIEREKEIFKQKIKLLTAEKTTVAGWTNVLSQALTHLNNHPIRPLAPYARLRTRAKTPSAVKVRKSWKTAIALTLTVNQCAMLLRTPSLILNEKGIIYQNLQWDVSQVWENYFAPLLEWKLLALHWDLIVLLQNQTC